jgi:REP element-mobilizing transposase RayT
MNSYRQILYHIVFCTQDRNKTLPNDHLEELYKYISGIIKYRNSVLYRINGTENHVHILSDLHPSVSLADFVKEIKTASNTWMKSTGRFPGFHSWSAGYAALTYGFRDKEMIVNYIRNQKEQHKKVSFEEEYKALLDEQGILWDERYVF